MFPLPQFFTHLQQSSFWSCLSSHLFLTSLLDPPTHPLRFLITLFFSSFLSVHPVSFLLLFPSSSLMILSSPRLFSSLLVSSLLFSSLLFSSLSSLLFSSLLSLLFSSLLFSSSLLFCPQVQSTSWMPHQQYVMQPTVSFWTSHNYYYYIWIELFTISQCLQISFSFLQISANVGLSLTLVNWYKSLKKSPK